MDSTGSFIKSPTSTRLPSGTGPNVDMSPDVPMPPRQPVASASKTLVPRRGRHRSRWWYWHWLNTEFTGFGIVPVQSVPNPRTYSDTIMATISY